MLFNQQKIKTKVIALQFVALLGFAWTVPFSIAVANIFIVSMAVLWVAECLLERKLIFPKTPLNWLIAIFVLSLLISFFETNYFYQSYRGVTKVLQRLGLFFLVIHILSTRERTGKFVKWLSFGYLVILLSGFFQLFFAADFIRGREIRFANQLPRITSSFEFPSQYSIYLLYMIFLYSFLAFSKLFSLRFRIYYVVISVLGLLSLFLTHARASWVAFFSAAVFSALLAKRAFLTLMAVVTLLVFIMLLSPSNVLIHKDAEGKEQSVSERFTLWNRAIEMIKAHPVTGVGINTYSKETDRYMKDDKTNLAGYYSHNSYLQMAAESGILTVMLFIAFLISSVVLGLRVIKKGILTLEEKQILKAVTVGTVGFMVFNVFETAFFSVQPTQIFYLFLGILFSLIIRNNEKIQEDKHNRERKDILDG